MQDETLLQHMTAFKSACENSIDTVELETLFAHSISKISAQKYFYCQFSGGSSSHPIFARLKSASGISPENIENYRLGLGGSIDPLINFTLKRMKGFEWKDYFNQTQDEHFLNGLFDEPSGFGLVLPVFGPDMNSGLFCIEFESHISKNTELQNTLLQWACQLAHYRYLELDN